MSYLVSYVALRASHSSWDSMTSTVGDGVRCRQSSSSSPAARGAISRVFAGGRRAKTWAWGSKSMLGDRSPKSTVMPLRRTRGGS